MKVYDSSHYKSNVKRVKEAAEEYEGYPTQSNRINTYLTAANQIVRDPRYNAHATAFVLHCRVEMNRGCDG